MKIQFNFLAAFIEVRSTIEVKKPLQKKKSSTPRKPGVQSISQKFTVNINQK